MTIERADSGGLRKRLVGALVMLPGLVVLVGVAMIELRVTLLERCLRSPDATQRRDALDEIARKREYRTVASVHRILEHDQDREVLASAGYATMRLGDPGGVEILRRRADAGPDDAVRARLIAYAARLSERDLRLADWMMRGLSSHEPWQRVGSAVGLLELGLPRGGQPLLDAAAAEPEVREFALDEFRRIAEPLGSAVGRPILDWPGEDPQEGDGECWQQLAAFWNDVASVRLLNDILNRLERRDDEWHQVNRLLHARQKVARRLE